MKIKFILKEGEGPRCTEATLNAFGIYGTCPIDGIGVLDALKKAGYKYKPLRHEAWSTPMWKGREPVGKTLGDFIKENPTGAFYLMTSRHAMALINGRLTDTADGTGRRRLVGGFIVTWEKEGKAPYEN